MEELEVLEHHVEKRTAAVKDDEYLIRNYEQYQFCHHPTSAFTITYSINLAYPHDDRAGAITFKHIMISYLMNTLFSYVDY